MCSATEAAVTAAATIYFITYAVNMFNLTASNYIIDLFELTTISCL